MKVFWTKESLVRLKEIEEYISRDNPDGAIKFIDSLVALSETLADNPEKGRIVPEFSIKEIRELLFKNYRMVYLLKKNRVEILTVFKGHRLFQKKEIKKILK